jgi:AcrR family transcriptional regulator
MTQTERPLRADARRNRERIMASAGELFASLGTDAQMDQIAAHSGLGLGTLYRHFPTKEALLTAIVSRRFEGMAQLAREAELIEDPAAAFEAVLLGYLEAAEGDSAFQRALLGSEDPQWSAIAEQKAEFRTVVTRIIARAVEAGAVREDLGFADFPLLACGIMATMYYKPGGHDDWHRHVDLVLRGVLR